MWFGVLGPLVVRDGDSVISVAAARQRVLLATLLVHAGAVVTAEALAETMWDGALPAGAETTLRSHVMRLRRVLGPAAGGRVVTRYPGYLIQASEEEVDLLRLRYRYREGGVAVRLGDWTRAWEMLTEALELWRGEPLADVPSELLHRDEVPALEQLRLQMVEWQMDAGLHLGRHAELVPELQSMARQFPLRERFHAQLMLALARCGRQAEALEAYRRARGVLVEELGAEPGPDLHELHQRILTADPAMAAPQPVTLAGNRPAMVVPRELPAPVAGFVGRAEELAVLTALLDHCAGQAPASIVISAIGGTAGVGKTALAVQWAHQVAGRFPDGQLYVNLRGYDPDRPVTAAEALAGFLRSLGVPAQDIPADEDERAARYRSLLAGKRMLIVLDNVGPVEQVRPLLPGSPGCAVVVTSRDSLAGLVVRDGASRLDLDLLPLQDAIGLLQELTGRRTDEDPEAAAILAERCCRLPLALRVAAELAAARPTVPLAELAAELTNQQTRLDMLQVGGDRHTAMRAVFSWSYRHLEPAAARAFRLLGLHPGTDFDAYSVAAITGMSLDPARRVLETLARGHLVQPAAPGRYGMHDLLRAYARELAEAKDTAEDRQEALIQLFDHYMYTAATAMDTLYPAERHQRPCVPPSASQAPPVTEPASARAWLDAERAAMVAVTAHAAGHGWPGYATQIGAILFRYLDAGSHYLEAISIHGHARAVAQRAGDRAAEASALRALAGVHWRQGRYEQAASHLQAALTAFQETGDRVGEAHTLDNLGTIYAAQSRHEAAITLHQQAFGIYRGTGDRAGEATALTNLGADEERQGQYDLASHHDQQALAIAQEIGDRHTECLALVNLGTVCLKQGGYQQAADHLRRALALCRETGYRLFAAEALSRIGDVCLRQGRTHEANDRLGEALALYREIGDRSGEADVLNSLGMALLADGQRGQVYSLHNTALSLAHQMGDKYQQARAHNGLACTNQAASDLGQAHQHWQQALALFTELGAPEADQVRAQLATVATDGPGLHEDAS
jgi:DNA-binding SARP family transcriptional activator